MLSIFSAMFHTATRQRPYDPPRHWVDRHRAPLSDKNEREADRYRRRLELDRTGLR